MEGAGIGWIAAIMIGGIAGWLAEMFMKSNMGVIMNVILGIVGAIVANFSLPLFGVVLGGWLGYLIAGSPAQLRRRGDRSAVDRNTVAAMVMN